MKLIIFSPQQALNAKDLGLRVAAEGVYAPLELQSMGAKTADALVASLQSFPTAVTSLTGWDSTASAKAIAGALELLRPIVDARMFESAAHQRRGLGAMPPRVGNFGRR